MRCTCEQAIRETWLEAAAWCADQPGWPMEQAADHFRARAAATLPAGGVKAPVRYTEATEPETAPSGPQDGATRAWQHGLTSIGAALDRAAARTAPGDARYWLRDGAGEQPGAAWPAVDSGVGGA